MTQGLEVLTETYVPHARNVIIFVGDGMNVPTITASRIYKAQTLHDDYDTPESTYLSFERLPHVALSKVWWHLSNASVT